MTKLSDLTVLVRRLEDAILRLRKGMSHTSPGSANIFRKNVNELENMLDLILNEPVISQADIEQVLTKGNECIKECIRPMYTGKTPSLPHPDAPLDDSNTTPPTVSGIHLILYLDATSVMRPYYKGQFGSDLKRLADYLENQCTLYSIPGTFSLVWFGDTKSSAPYVIAENGQSLDKIAEKISAPMQLSSGGSTRGSGLYSIEETIETVCNPAIANTIIFATASASKEEDLHVTPQSVDNKLQNLNINLKFGVIPTKKMPDISFLFSEVRNMQDKNISYNLVPWGYRALHQ